MKTFGLVNIWRFYRDGFREMTWGRTLWIIILVKLFVLFAVLRVFFFRPVLAGLDADEKPAAVAGELLRRPAVTASSHWPQD